MAACSSSSLEPIWVMHMTDPETFWFIGAGDEDIREETDKNFTEFMENQPAALNPQPYIPVAGELVAVQHPDMKLWQRAEVQDVIGPDGDQCYIFMVDHGIAVTVPTSTVKPLKEPKFQKIFLASRLRLRGLNPITTEVTTDGYYRSKLKATKNWDTSAFTLVANMLRSADSCYISTTASSYEFIEDTVFGELYLNVKGEIVCVSDELLKKQYAGKKSDSQKDEIAYKKDPDSLSLGPDVKDNRQVTNPMGSSINKLKLQEIQENEDYEQGIGGLATKPKNRILQVATEPSVDQVRQKADDSFVQYFPAGLNVNDLTRTGSSKSHVRKFGSQKLLKESKQTTTDLSKTSPRQQQNPAKVVETHANLPNEPLQGESKLSRHSRKILEKLQINEVLLPKDVSPTMKIQEVEPKLSLRTQKLLALGITVDPKVSTQNLDVEQKLLEESKTTFSESTSVHHDKTAKPEIIDVSAPSVTSSSSDVQSNSKVSRRSLKLLEQIKAQEEALTAGKNTDSSYVSPPKKTVLLTADKSPKKTDSTQYQNPSIGAVDDGDTPKLLSNTASPTDSPGLFKFDNAQDLSRSYKTSLHQAPKKFDSVESHQAILNTPHQLKSMSHNTMESSRHSNSEGHISDLLRMNRILVHGKHVDPIQEIAEAKFPVEIHKALESLKYCSMTRLQKYVWPAILHGDNVIMVGPQNSGKTIGFIVPLVSCILNRNNYSKLPKSNGPLAVILCSGSRSCEMIHEMCTKFLSSSRDETRIIVTHGGGAEIEQKINLVNGCEILISTPRCFLRLLGLSKALVNLNRLCHLVLDEADILIEIFEPEVHNILLNCKTAIQRRLANGCDSNPLQLITASEKWSLSLYCLIHDITPHPLVCIGSYLEAAIYAHVRPKLDILEANKKPEKILAILDEKKGLFKTVIVCQSVGDVEKLVKYLEENKYTVLSAHEGMILYNLDDVRSQWKTSHISGRYPLLVCTDGILPDMLIDDAMFIIHYNLPPTKTAFGVRFSCLMGNYPNIHEKIDRNRPDSIVHVFVDEQNSQQLPAVLEFMRRLGANILPMLENVAKNLATSKETDKIGLPLCYNLKAYGRCHDMSTCPNRHAVIDEDTPVNIPIRGRVKLKIFSVLDTCCFSARLLEVTTEDGTTQTFADDYVYIAMELALHFGPVNNRLMHGLPIVGDICAVETKINLFQRAEVIAITSRSSLGQATYVKVKLVDKGNTMDIKVQNLLALPVHLQELPPQVIEVFLCCLVPSDLDLCWSTVSYMKMTKWIADADASEKDGTFLIGDIKLSLRNTLWLDPLHIKRTLRTIESEIVKVALRRQLLKDNMAVENPKHLEKLYELCRQAEMDHIINDTRVHAQEKYDVKSQVTEDAQEAHWAFLPDDDDSYGVIFLTADDPGQLFVRQFEFELNLSRLTKAIQKHVNNQKAIIGMDTMIIKEGTYCLGLFNTDGLWHRAKVLGVDDNGMVEIFFVDHGDRMSVNAASDIRVIDDRLMRVLPFQAIECSLAGLKPEDGKGWNDQCTDALFDITVDDEDRAKVLKYKIFKTDQLANCTGGQKYTVALIDPSLTEDSVLNRILLENNLACPKEEESSFIQNLPKVVDNPQFEDDSDEEMLTVDSHVLKDQVAVPLSTSTEMVVYPEVIKLCDLKGVKAQSTNETEDTLLAEDETCFDFEIDDVRKFIFDMIQGNHKDAELQLMVLDALPDSKAQPVPKTLPALTDNTDNIMESRKESSNDYTASKFVIEPGSSSGITPNVVWYQDMGHIHLSIEIIDVIEYHISTEPMRLQFFSDIGGEVYELDLSLFGAIDPDLTEDFKTGRRVCVKMWKIYQGKWPHLLKTPDKHHFWLKYNIDHAEEPEDKREKLLVEEDEELDLSEYVASPASGLGTSDYKPISQKDGIVADFQYNDSDSDESVNEDFIEADKQYEFFDYHDPLN